MPVHYIEWLKCDKQSFKITLKLLLAAIQPAHDEINISSTSCEIEEKCSGQFLTGKSRNISSEQKGLLPELLSLETCGAVFFSPWVFFL